MTMIEDVTMPMTEEDVTLTLIEEDMTEEDVILILTLTFHYGFFSGDFSFNTR